MSDSAHLLSMSSDEEEEDVYYSDSDQNINEFNIKTIGFQNELLAQNVSKTGFSLRRPQEVINTSIATQTIDNNIETNCCLVEKNAIKSEMFSNSKNGETFNELNEYLINSLNVMKCDQRLSYEEWDLRLESTFDNFVFSSRELNDSYLKEMLTSFYSFIDGIETFDPKISCVKETEVSSDKPSTREVSTQTDISGLIILEDIYLQ